MRPDCVKRRALMPHALWDPERSYRGAQCAQVAEGRGAGCDGWPPPERAPHAGKARPALESPECSQHGKEGIREGIPQIRHLPAPGICQDSVAEGAYRGRRLRDEPELALIKEQGGIRRFQDGEGAAVRFCCKTLDLVQVERGSRTMRDVNFSNAQAHRPFLRVKRGHTRGSECVPRSHPSSRARPQNKADSDRLAWRRSPKSFCAHRYDAVL